MQLYIQGLRIAVLLHPTLKMGAAGLVHNVGTNLIKLSGVMSLREHQI